MRFGIWDRRLVPVVGAVVLLLISASYGSFRMAEEEGKVSRERRGTMSETTRSRTMQAALAAERDYLLAHPEPTREIAASGFLERQDRLAVSQAVEALGAQHRLISLRVSFAPEEVIDDRAYLGDATVIISTPVSVNLSAANEDDAYGFIDALLTQFSGVAIVESASIRRGVGGSDGWSAKATLAIRWETVRAVADAAALTDAGR